MTTKSYYANLADNLFIALFVSIIGLSMMLSGCDKGDESVPCNENPNLTRECVQEGTGYSGKYICAEDGTTLLCNVPNQPPAEKPCSSRPSLNSECGAKVGSSYVPGHFECADPTAKVDPVCTPDDDATTPGTCKTAVQNVKAWSYKTIKCSSAPQLSGVVEDGYGNRQVFHGTSANEGQEENVELKDDGTTCGPIKVALIGNTGDMYVQMSENMKLYSLNTAWVDWAWQKVKKTSPTATDYDGDVFPAFLLDLFECERGSSCKYPQLKSGTTPPNPVVEESINNYIDASPPENSVGCQRLFFILVQK